MRRGIPRAGFTLIELMLSVALTFLVVGFVMVTFSRQHDTYTVVDDVAEAQQSLRAIGDLLEREIRITGFLVPEAAAVCGADQTNNPDVLFVSDSDSLNPTNEETLGIGAQIQSGFNGGAGIDTLTIDDVVLDGIPFYDTNGDGIADSDFRDDGGAIIVDRANPGRGAACGVVTVLSPSSIRVDYDPAGGGNLGPGAANPPDLVVVPAHVYTVNGAMQLERDGMALAGDIEDFQVAFFYDEDDDGMVTSDLLEYPGSRFGNVYVSANWDNRNLREVRVSLVARTAGQDPGAAKDASLAQFEFQPTENRVAPGGAADGFRRRVLTATVRPRNVGARGI